MTSSNYPVRTYFHSPKGVQAIEVRLLINKIIKNRDKYFFSETIFLENISSSP